MVAALGDAAVQDVTFVAQPFFCSPERGIKLGEIAAADIAQLAALQVVPDPFHWIEIGSVAW